MRTALLVLILGSFLGLAYVAVLTLDTAVERLTPCRTDTQCSRADGDGGPGGAS